VTWFASPTNETESLKEGTMGVLAVDFDFPSGHARFWTGIGDLTIAGVSYTGIGALGSAEPATENATLVAERKTYKLTGVDPALVLESDIDGSTGRDIVEYLLFLDVVTKQLVATPEINWEGFIDSFRRVDGAQPIIEVAAEWRGVILDKADGWRYTDQHQQAWFPGDTGFDQMIAIQNKSVLWGGKRTVVGQKPGGRYWNGSYAD
jgi:hypothetical protein